MPPLRAPVAGRDELLLPERPRDGAFVAYGMLAYLAVLALRRRESRVGVVFGAAPLVVLIGFSRVYLGVHYVSDVVAGYAAGGVWLSALITGAEVVRRSKQETEPRGRTS